MAAVVVGLTLLVAVISLAGPEASLAAGLFLLASLGMLAAIHLCTDLLGWVLNVDWTNDND
jgi:hypothetical protein